MQGLLVSPATAGGVAPHPVRMRGGVMESQSKTPSRIRPLVPVPVPVVVVRVVVIVVIAHAPARAA